jgi:hypothetical protein
MGSGSDQRQGVDGQPRPDGANSPGLAPGKRTLTEQLPVQHSPNGARGSKSDETLLDRYVSSSSGGRPAAVQRKPDETQSPQHPEIAQVDRLIQLLAAPVAVPAGRDDAHMLLSSLSIPRVARGDGGRRRSWVPASTPRPRDDLDESIHRGEAALRTVCRRARPHAAGGPSRPGS